MQTGILKKIYLLLEMAESTANADMLKAELKEIDLQLGELKDELVFSRDSKEGDRYFKISEKTVDENIKVSLEAKIKKQENAIKKLQKEIDAVVNEEGNLHDNIAKLKEEINLSSAYINTLNARLTSINESSTKEYYADVLQDENEKVKELKSSLENLESKDKDTLDKLNYLSRAMEEMNTKLEDERARLAETKANLGSQLSYIDEELKEQDEKRILELQKRIADLEKRRLEIITDPAMIASEAQELIINDERASALAKIQELVTIVKSKPYMDIPSSSELTTMLQEEEDAASTARDEFASLIDTKNYSSGDTEVIEERINYLNNQIASLEDKIKIAREEISTIDDIDFKNLANHLHNTVDVYNRLQEELKEYQIIIDTENDDKTPKRRAILASAFDRKQKELEEVASIIDRYKENQKALVNKAYILEAENITQYENEIKVYKQEIREMEFLLENASKAKDVLAIENDKQKLKDLDTAVKNIKHRQKYSQTPSEIYDEIEISLGTMDIEGSSYATTSNYEQLIPTNNYDIEDDLKIEDVVEELPSEEVVEELKPLEIEENEENSFVIGDYKKENEELIDASNIEE